MAKLLLECRADVVGDPAIEQSCPLHLLVRKAKDAKKGGHNDGYLTTSKVIVGYLANQCAVDHRVPISPLEGPGVEHQKLVEVVTKALSSACYWEDETLIQCIIEGFMANEASRMWLRAAIREAHSRSRSEILNASNGYSSGLQSRRILLMESSACPLFLAVTASGPSDRTERIIALLLKVCDPNVVLPSGKSPLYLACEIGASDSIIRMLLSGGAKVDMCTCSGRNALFAAVEKGYFAAVETLCSTGRCVNLRHITQRTNGGVSPFMLAENKGRLQMMLAMLEAYTREARISIDMFGADSAGSMSKLAATVTHPYLNKMCHKYRAKLAARVGSTDHQAKPIDTDEVFTVKEPIDA
ncbi:hypothetical protein Pmar_PMAR015312 [Perkinsus marinus ATCC 50983]|uniref:Uncharacterized protein n=1 Tax=Perkinsus marinus (strain ATCC 50983 / TXsc) TaxID=423536 RepID=C5KL94_PERM5|nr:hypothetical protein Pmar_PMAR015312 [Perkinsus marinus ATCC 50983]EER14767.1 hypothetical protein Pmar_PMAR015312 [Perkinsus marinus ATCC 50983]|eukprot:XP_002782971.1 hypothetical protein Pmar_PMAR015312 [Perkinsus marinus ATCC 50983]